VLAGFAVDRLGELQGHVQAYEAGQGKLSRLVSMSWINAWRYLGKLMGAKGEQLDPEGLKRLKAEAEVLARLQKMQQDLGGQAFFRDLPLASSAADLIAWQAQKLRNTLLLAEWLTFREWEAFRPRVNNGAFDEGYWAVVKGDAVRLREIELSMARTVQAWQTHFHPTQAARLAQGLIHPAAALEYASALQASFQKDSDDLIQLDTLLDSLDAEQRQALAHLHPHIAALDGAPKAGLLQQAQNGILLAWLSLIEAHLPELLETSSRQMPERLATYGQLVQSRTATVTGLIQRRLKDAIVANISFNRLNNPVTYRDIAHQVRKQRQLWPVRKLVQSFWEDGLSRLMPCWMASPESVAAIFPMVKDYFDLVIFDEASQCYVERALPVMLRGKQCVIAGDDQQLPPFDLYNVKVEEESESAEIEEQMPLEVESILDLSRNIFPQAKLNWHYRSTEQDLINFSNFAFYEGRLSMAPPAQHEELSSPPISFVKVAGLWERNRNEVEARQVVTLVEQLVRRPENPTVGVVTFNYFQKELIRELLELRLVELGMAGDKEGAALLHKAMEREEGEERQGIFIKNIENVQGDERDVIIFSVGYARTPAGKLVANFGLLNQKGGGNRLNVAITRAKKKKIIVCSIDPEELQVDGAKHDGPLLLKRYLQYARALSQGDHAQVQTILAQLRTLGPDKTGTTATLATPEGILPKLKADLEARGWKVETGLGDHNFMLDLALLAPDGSYVLGVECEGRSYFAGRSAKEREVYRPGLLQRRGWQIYRLWNRNYFLNPTKEVDRIVELADRVLQQRQAGAAV
jgi:AAA domain/REase_MTES_1575